MRLPTFIIPGAPKAGTSALWAYLNDHPEICMAVNKEPRFFSQVRGEIDREVPGDGNLRAGNFGRGFKWYSGLFEKKENARAWGEASTHYFSAPDSPDLIREHVPDARLVFMLRDPVQRLYSHYWQEYKLGWELPDFEEMYRTNHPRFRFYCHVSAYRKHLGDYLARFSKEQVMVLLDTDLRRDPLGVYRRVCAFVGVGTDFVPETLGKTFNQQTAPKSRAFQRWRTRMQTSWIANVMPDRLRGRLGKVLEAMSRLNNAPIAYPALDPSIRADLVSRFDEDIRFVEELLGVSLDAWRAPRS